MAGFQQTGQDVGFADTAGSPIVDKTFANVINAVTGLVGLKDNLDKQQQVDTSSQILSAIQGAKDKFERANAIKPFRNVGSTLNLIKEQLVSAFKDNSTEVSLTFDKVFKINQSKSAFVDQGKRQAKNAEILNSAINSVVSSNDGVFPESAVIAVVNRGNVEDLRRMQLEIDAAKQRRTTAATRAGKTKSTIPAFILRTTNEGFVNTSTDIKNAYIDELQAGNFEKAAAIREQVIALSSQVKTLSSQAYTKSVNDFIATNPAVSPETAFNPKNRLAAQSEAGVIYKELLSFVTDKSFADANKQKLQTAKDSVTMQSLSRLSSSANETASALFLSMVSGFSVPTGNKADVSQVGLNIVGTPNADFTTMSSAFKAFGDAITTTPVNSIDDMERIQTARSFIDLQKALSTGNGEDVVSELKALDVPGDKGADIVVKSVSAAIDTGKQSDNLYSKTLVSNTLSNLAVGNSPETNTKEIGGTLFENVDSQWIKNNIKPENESRFKATYNLALGNYLADTIAVGFENGIKEAEQIDKANNLNNSFAAFGRPLPTPAKEIPLNLLEIKIGKKNKISISSPAGYPDINKSPIINDLIPHIQKIIDNYGDISGDTKQSSALLGNLISANTGIKVDNTVNEPPLVKDSPIPANDNAEIIAVMKDNPNLTFKEVKKLMKGIKNAKP